MCEKTKTKPIDYLSDRVLNTNLLASLIMTFGAVLIVSGLYVIITGPSTSALSTLDWIPGIPFYICDLANFTSTVIALAILITGTSLLLVGLGLRKRYRLARLAALVMFAFASFFQFVQFLLLGVLGSPTSVIELCVDGVIIYLLQSKVDLSRHSETKSPYFKNTNHALQVCS